MLELIINGVTVEKLEFLADGTPRDVRFRTKIARSSWVALRVLGSGHTYPVFVSVGGMPVRASRRSAEWLRKCVDALWTEKHRFISESERPAAAEAYDHARRTYDMIIAESRDGGLLEPDEQHRLHQALQMSMQSTEQLMIPRSEMYAVDVDLSPAELLARIKGSSFTRLPVYRGSLDNVIGLVHTKDVLAHYLDHGEVPAVEAVLRPISTVFEKVKGDRLLHLMKQKRSRQAVVVDEYGGVSGIVTIEGILNRVFDPEWTVADPEAPRLQPLPDGRVRLPGRMRLDEAEAVLGVRWTGTTHTVGGKVLDAFGRLPAPGEQVEIEGVRVEVERVHHRRIDSVLVTPVAKPGQEPGREAGGEYGGEGTRT